MSSLHPIFQFAFPICLFTLACNADGTADTGESESTTDGDGTGELRSNEPHDENPQLEPGEANALAAANHALTLELYHSLRGGPATNRGFSISAYSLQAVFGMLYGGAVDPAHGEIAQTLHFTLEGDRQHVAHNWLDDQLGSRSLPGDEWAEPVELRTANRLWMLDDLADLVSSDYLDLLATHYDAGLFLGNFDEQPDAEREAINAWVSERTNDLIPQLFPAGAITEFTKLVLVNALYLKAPWAEPFSESATSKRDFTRLDDEVILVDTMHKSDKTMPYLAGPDYQAAALSLRGGQLELVIILPDDFEAFEATLDGPKLTALLDDLGNDWVSLWLPKFTLTAELELVETLQELGMSAPFSNPNSYDKIALEIGVVESVIQQVVIAIDEEGIEAAAASGIVGDGDGDGEPQDFPELMIVDRPFLLAIHDRPTNTLLFFGRVLDPNAS